MQEALAKLTAAGTAIQEAQTALGSVSVDECPQREEIAMHLTEAYASVGEAQRLANS